MRLSLFRFDVSQSTPLQVPSELAALNSESIDVSRSELPGTSMQLPVQLPARLPTYGPGLPDQTTSRLELPAIPLAFELSSQAPPDPQLPTAPTSHQPVGTDGLLVASSAEPMELDSNNFRSRARRRSWDFDWAAYDSPSQLERPSVTNRGSISDFQDLIEHAPSQVHARGALASSDIGNQGPTRLALDDRDVTRTLVDHVQESESPIVTFHCNRMRSCERSCSCACHSRNQYKSPAMFNKLIGSLFVGYTGLPVSTLPSKCDSDTCVNQVSRDIQVVYVFPAWFMMKTLDFFCRTLFTTGPSFGLSTRNRVETSLSSGVNIISLARNGDKAGIITLLEKRKASLTDIASVSGDSPFNVR